MTTNVNLHGQLWSYYAKALGNYIKTFSNTEIPRHASKATASIQAVANLLIYSFSPVLILVNSSSFISFPLKIIFYISPTMICVVVVVVVLSVKNDNLLL